MDGNSRSKRNAYDYEVVSIVRDMLALAISNRISGEDAGEQVRRLYSAAVEELESLEKSEKDW